MADLKRTQQEISSEDVCCVGSEDKYPWGMRLHLQGPELEKLGLGLPQVGSEVAFTAVAKVQSVSSSEEIDGDKRSSVELQLTEMSVPNASSDDDKAERMYAES